MPAQAQHGCEPGNLLPNCGFDTFYGSPPRQLPEAWTAFVLSGDLTFMQDEDTFWGAPSLRMWSNGEVFTAGIWAQAQGLQPGVAYRASLGWGGPNEPDSFGRRLGIDPTGGTDVSAPSVVWGPMHRGPGRILNYQPPDLNIDVSAVAQSGTVTVFVMVDHNYSTGDNYIFVDAVSLVVDPVQPTPAPPSPTAAPVRAAAQQPAPSATRASTVTPTVTPTATSTSTPSVTPTPTVTPTSTTTPTPTITLTPSPSPTSTLPPRPAATVSAVVQERRIAPVPNRDYMLGGGVMALTCAGLLGVATLRWRRRPSS